MGGATWDAFDKVLLMGEQCDISPGVLCCPDCSLLVKCKNSSLMDERVGRDLEIPYLPPLIRKPFLAGVTGMS